VRRMPTPAADPQRESVETAFVALRAGPGCRVTLRVYDVQAGWCAAHGDGPSKAGPVDVQWDGLDDLGCSPDRCVLRPLLGGRQARQYQEARDPVFVPAAASALAVGTHRVNAGGPVSGAGPASVRAGTLTPGLHIGSHSTNGRRGVGSVFE